MKTLSQHTPVDLTAYPHRWWAFVILSFSLLVISIDNTILNVALPTLANQFSATSSQLQWMVDAYVLVFAGLLLTAGSLSDRFGRKRALMIGLLLLGGGSIWCAASNSANMMIAARAFMGLGGALIMPSTLSITTNMFPEKERGRAIGAWAGVAGVGIILGPVFGGWLLEHFSWNWVFLVNIPLIVITIAGGLFLVPESRDPQQSRLDPVGALLSIGGLVSLVYGIIEVPTYGWGDATIITAFIAAAILLTIFAIWEMRSRAPMLDVSLFKNPRFSAASLSLTLAAFAMFGSIFFLTQYLQAVHGFTPLEAGVRVIPLALGLMVGAPLSGRIAEIIGTKITATVGILIIATGLALMSTITTTSDYGLVAATLAIIGFGMGTTMAPVTASIMNALPLGRAGVGSAVNDTTRQVGGALGVAVLGSILSSTYQSTIDNAAALQMLPPQIKGMVRDSIESATKVAAHIGGPVGHAIATTANDAFVSGMSHAVLAGAGVTLCGALVALLFLPARSKPQQESLNEQQTSDTIETQEEHAEAL